MKKEVKQLAEKIAKVNNIEMDKALEIAKKALNIKEETKEIEKEYYLFNDSETAYKGVKNGSLKNKSSRRNLHHIHQNFECVKRNRKSRPIRS